MAVFNHKEFADHEEIAFGHDPKTGLQAIIAIHNTNLGPAMGGCRMWPYAGEQDAITDVLRLSRGMTYKSAISNLPLGGGKAVIIGDPRKDKTPELMQAMGRFIGSLGGRYVGAEDSGTSVADLKIMAEVTDHVAGIHQRRTSSGGVRSGDPSPATAYGVFMGIKAAIKHRLGHNDPAGLKVAIQGLGNVGYRLARRLHEAGAQLWVSDIYRENAQKAVDEFDAILVEPDAIHRQNVDVYAPCALGAIVNDGTLPEISAAVIAGGANNQLAESRHGQLLRDKNVLYAPDYVINAGGIIDIAYERAALDPDPEKIKAHIESIYATLEQVFQRADAENAPTHDIADRIAEERFLKK